MDFLTYLRSLHDIAYQANIADVPDMRSYWQRPEHAETHVNACLKMVRSLISEREFEIFLDCFGDFDSFVVALKEHRKGLTLHIL